MSRWALAPVVANTVAKKTGANANRLIKSTSRQGFRLPVENETLDEFRYRSPL